MSNKFQPPECLPLREQRSTIANTKKFEISKKQIVVQKLLVADPDDVSTFGTIIIGLCVASSILFAFLLLIKITFSKISMQ